MPLRNFAVYLIALVALSMVIELIVDHHTTAKHRHFTWPHYAFFVTFPFSVAILALLNLGLPYLILFSVSAVIGLVMEWIFGYYYERIVGQKLWRYNRLALNGYTSWLVMPLWGLAGLLFIYLGKLLNI